MYVRNLLTIVASLALAHASLADDKLPAKHAKFFEAEVRPLLVGQCLKCHGDKKQQGKLRLDSRAAMIKGGESGPAIEPGEPDDSLLIEAIRHESFEMPPDKKLPDAAVDAIARWIEMGAPWPQHGGKDEVLREAGRKITDEDRAWWAYQQVKRPRVPATSGDEWSRSPIDRFIYHRLEAAGLKPAPEADRRTLIRRATFDLIGLPPTPDQVDAFVNDASPAAYEKLIDRLLASPRYGEHWASYWLDLVRFAESDGFRADFDRPDAAKYRDYVIRSFNSDKPYDRFVREQLAGDEMFAGDRDALTATMFLRHGIYEHNQRDCETQRQDMLNDITDVTADVFLAAGMGCARCHDHKFDALLQKDYFRLQAFFAPLAFDNRGVLASVPERQTYEQRSAAWEAKTAQIRRKLWTIEKPVLARKAGGQGFSKFDPTIKKLILMWPGDRTPHEQQIVELAERQLEYKRAELEKQLSEQDKVLWKQLHAELAKFDGEKPAPLAVTEFVARDVGRAAPPSFIPGEREAAIAPGFLSVIDESPAQIPELPKSMPSTGRRTVLANWIANEQNPLSTRVITNRIWQYHFGRGIVASSSDFGHLGEKPTHPELLDWLTTEFLRRKWRIKPMHRVIMLSATYRQASLVEATEIAKRVDSQNELLWRSRIRRPHAEAIRDSILAVTGELGNRKSSTQQRSIYLKVKRNSPDAILSAFDFPDRISSMASRSVTTTPIQSLLVANSDWMAARAEAFAARLSHEKLTSADALVRRAYMYAYNRPPTETQLHAARTFLGQQQSLAKLAAKQKKEDDDARLARGAEIGSPAQVLKFDPKAALPSEDFTIEAVIVLRSLFRDASVRTIASHWNSSQDAPGWAFGVTSERSKYTPRNLILQLVGQSEGGERTYEVIASNLRLELDRPYYVAVSVKIAKAGKEGVTFYVKDLSNVKNTLQTARVAHKVHGNYRSDSRFAIGGRDHGQSRHYWDGWIDDLRLSPKALSKDMLLVDRDKPNDDPMFWDLENVKRAPPAVKDVQQSALVDFCHLLLSSNEFLYID